MVYCKVSMFHCLSSVIHCLGCPNIVSWLPFAPSQCVALTVLGGPMGYLRKPNELGVTYVIQRVNCLRLAHIFPKYARSLSELSSHFYDNSTHISGNERFTNELINLEMNELNAKRIMNLY